MRWLKNIAKGIYYLTISYFTYLMLLITLQYIPVNYDVAFLRLKQSEIKLSYYQIAFFSHVYTSILVLAIGIPQFSATVRKRYSVIHKNLGKLYIFLVLCVASPSGFIMALHANGGIFSKLSFVIQAILWFVFTLKAYQSARTGNWNQHRKFMLRSFALTLSAITLRLSKYFIVNTFQLPPMDTYKIVAWMGWIVNILLLEIYFWKGKKL